MGLDSMPALMLVATEHEFSIILANQQAEQIREERAA